MTQPETNATVARRDPIAVLFDAADVAALDQTEVTVRAVLPLTPSARAALIDTRWPALNHRDRFGDFAQARATVRVRNARGRLFAELAEIPALPITVRELFCDHFHRLAYSAWRLWFCLGGDGPWLMRTGRDWTEAASRQDAHGLALDHMLVSQAAAQAAIQPKPPAWPAFYKWLRRRLLRKLRGPAPLVVLGAHKEQFGLLTALGRAHPPVRRLVVRESAGPWREYARLLRSLWTSDEAPKHCVMIAHDDGQGRALFDRLVDAMADPVVARAFAPFRDLIAARIGRVAASLSDVGTVIEAAEPDLYTAAEISDLSNWLVAECCGRASIPRMVMSRNAHAPANGIAADASTGYLRARYPAGLVDLGLFWSPLGTAAGASLIDSSGRPAVHEFHARPVTPLDQAARKSTRMVLVADTYAAWWFPHIWAFQTSDEFVDGVQGLVHAMSQLDDVRLLIRAKHKRECDLVSLTRIVEPPPWCDIKIRDVPFTHDIHEAALLVTFHSTTIEEALRARKPVLLWGGTGRFSYLPARRAPPTPDDRAPIYRTDTAENLPAMIGAILDAHAGAPLTDDEIAPYVGDRPGPTVDDLAAAIAAGDPTRAWQMPGGGARAAA